MLERDSTNSSTTHYTVLDLLHSERTANASICTSKILEWFRRFPLLFSRINRSMRFLEDLPGEENLDNAVPEYWTFISGDRNTDDFTSSSNSLPFTVNVPIERFSISLFERWVRRDRQRTSTGRSRRRRQLTSGWQSISEGISMYRMLSRTVRRDRPRTVP